MLGDAAVVATVAVKDLEAAKQFYGGTLGLKQTKEDEGGVTYGSGASALFVYPSSFAGSNKATYAGWQVEDLEAVVENLKVKGVTFEHYPDMPGTKLEGDIHVMGPMKMAWFKDPDGNMFSN